MPFQNPYSELKTLVASLEADFEKSFDKGNLAAGTRVRNGCQAIRNLAYRIRGEVTANKHHVEPKV